MLKAGRQIGIPCKPLEEEIILLHMITRKRCSWKLKKFWIENKYFFVKCWPFARRDLHTIIWFTRNCSKDKQRWLPHSAASCLWKFFKGSSCCEGPQQKLGVPSFPQIALEQWQRYQLQCKNFLEVQQYCLEWPLIWCPKWPSKKFEPCGLWKLSSTRDQTQDFIKASYLSFFSVTICVLVSGYCSVKRSESAPQTGFFQQMQSGHSACNGKLKIRGSELFSFFQNILSKWLVFNFLLKSFFFQCFEKYQC